MSARPTNSRIDWHMPFLFPLPSSERVRGDHLGDLQVDLRRNTTAGNDLAILVAEGS